MMNYSQQTKRDYPATPLEFYYFFAAGLKFYEFTFSFGFFYSKQLQILLSLGDGEGAASLARAASQRYSQSVPLWSLCLQTLMQLESGDVGQLFQDALAHVNPKVI